MIKKSDFDLRCGDALEVLSRMEDKSVQCCVTSPPYYGLRDYGTGTWIGGDPNCSHYRTSKYSKDDSTGHKAMGEQGQAVGDAIYKSVCKLCGATRVDKQVGLEETPEEYIERLVKIFREVKRVLKDDGTLWVNIGDTYNVSSYHKTEETNGNGKQGTNRGSYENTVDRPTAKCCKPKDLIGIPWMLAFALRADGWYLRQDIIWCLSGGAYVYANTTKGTMPIMVRELARLNPSTVKLWNGKEWVQMQSIRKSNDFGRKLQIVLRSGERINCTDGHKWVLEDGSTVFAKDLKVGDILKSYNLPDNGEYKPGFLTEDVLWFLGLYLAEGSHSDDCIQISLNTDEFSWYDRINDAVEHLGGTTKCTVNGNTLNIRVHSRVMDSVIKQFIGGKVAKNKHLTNACWRLSNDNLRHILEGYFDGDGHYDKGRIRIGFTRNYYLERDLRTAAARLGATLTLTPCFSKCNGKKFPSFRGEWRWNTSGHFNCRDRGEIVKIVSGNGRNFYDISVDSDDHTYCLASGVLTHNCKPNPMPESVTDRCTKSHEYIFLLSKSPKYLFNSDSILEEANFDGRHDTINKGSKKAVGEDFIPNGSTDFKTREYERWKFKKVSTDIKFGGNKYGGNNDSHYQTYSGNQFQQRVLENGDVEIAVRNKRDVWRVPVSTYSEAHFATYPEELILPCILAGTNEGDTVLDPFNGSGTTGIVAIRNGRKYIGIDLNQKYIDLAYARFDETFYRKKIIKEKKEEEGEFRKANLLGG